MSLTERSLHDLLAAFASSDPTPGGGSASAMASAVGASLLMMVAGLPKTRSGSDEDRQALAEARAALGTAQHALERAVDQDTAAYDRVAAAYKLPKATEAEQGARKAAIQRALRAATDVPLEVMRLSAGGLVAAVAVARHGHKAAASDVGVAVGLLEAGLAGARLNVEINVGSLSDTAYVEGVKTDVGRLEREGRSAAEAARSLLQAG